jgi:hypothetical protein
MRIIKILLLSFLMLGLHANAYRKTALSLRPIAQDMTILNTGIHNNFKNKIEKHLNFNFQASAFAKGSVNGSGLGKYFAVNGVDNIIKIDTAADLGALIADNDKDVWNRFIVHRYNGTGSDSIIAHMVLDPKQEAYGVLLDLFGYLDNPIKKNLFSDYESTGLCIKRFKFKIYRYIYRFNTGKFF